MQMMHIIALGAAILLPLLNIPVIVSIVQNRSSKGFNLVWLLAAWVGFGLMAPSAFVSTERAWQVLSTLNFVLYSVLLVFAVIYRNERSFTIQTKVIDHKKRYAVSVSSPSSPSHESHDHSRRQPQQHSQSHAQSQVRPSGTKIYVGNLNYQINEDQVQELFSKYGTVLTVSIVRDRRSKQSKGYGFVEMTTPEELQRALVLNGADLGGRNITVLESKSNKDTGESRPADRPQDRGGDREVGRSGGDRNRRFGGRPRRRRGGGGGGGEHRGPQTPAESPSPAPLPSSPSGEPAPSE